MRRHWKSRHLGGRPWIDYEIRALIQRTQKNDRIVAIPILGRLHYQYVRV